MMWQFPRRVRRVEAVSVACAAPFSGLQNGRGRRQGGCNMVKRHLAYFLTCERVPDIITSCTFTPACIKFIKERVFMAIYSPRTGVGLVRYRCLLEVRVSIGLSGYSHAADASDVPPALASGSRLPWELHGERHKAPHFQKEVLHERGGGPTSHRQIQAQSL